MLGKAAIMSCALTLLSAPAAASGQADLANCYDVKIEARAIDQIPGEISDCGDCIIMAWPWFVDLKVRRSLAGQVKSRVISTLSIQHTYRISRYGIWFLRRNMAGGFNVVRYEDDAEPELCPAGTAPTAPYLKPGDGKTLADLRKAGEQRYGHHIN